MSLEKLPKRIALSLCLVKALDIPSTLKLCRGILYLWREFFIKVMIRPKIVSYKVTFTYKDKEIGNYDLKDLKELVRIIEEVKRFERNN